MNSVEAISIARKTFREAAYCGSLKDEARLKIYEKRAEEISRELSPEDLAELNQTKKDAGANGNVQDALAVWKIYFYSIAKKEKPSELAIKQTWGQSNDVPPSIAKPLAVISPRYSAYFDHLKGHVWPTEKYHLVRQKLDGDRRFNVHDCSDLINNSNVALIHTSDYLNRLEKIRNGNADHGTDEVRRNSEFYDKLDANAVNGFFLMAEGTLQACRKALDEGIAAVLGGGLHHAYSGWADGYCLINDMAIAIRVLQDEGKIKNAAVIDCDLHHGNGTASIAKSQKGLHTFSIQQGDLWPFIRSEDEALTRAHQPLMAVSDKDINLPNGAGDAEYLNALKKELSPFLDRYKPEFAIYQSGADPYKDDEKGLLQLTKEGLRQRDRWVLEECATRKIPLAVTLGGGYAFFTHDVAAIHFATIEEAYSNGYRRTVD